MMTGKTNKKPISRNYAVKSDDDPKTNKKPISRNYAIKSDDDPKTNKNQYPGTMLSKAMMIQKPLLNQEKYLSKFVLKR